MRRWAALGVLGLLLALGSCATGPAQGPAETPIAEASTSSGPVLRIDGESVVLGDAVGKPQSLQVFVTRVQQQLLRGRANAVGELVRMFPDRAREAVLATQTSLQIQHVLAAWLDVLAAPEAGGWAAFVADRAERPKRYEAWERERASARADLRRGGFAEVAERSIAIPAKSPAPWAELDALRLRATATLAAGRPADAARIFERAADRVATWDAGVAAQANLYAALAHQLVGNLDAAVRARDMAVRSLSLATMHDPMTLRLLLEITGPSDANPSMTRRALRARLGRVELNREVPQAALLAWRAAENEPGSTPSRERLRLGQAEAFLAVGQDEPAIAMLIGLAETDLRPEALAMLGLAQMSRGQVNVGIAVLREAVAATDVQTHPAVYADSGLALLSVGQEAAGLALVEQARGGYQDRNDTAALVQLLRNELRYAEAVGNEALLVAVQQALIDVGRTPSKGVTGHNTPPITEQ
ncbi:MAG: hypothetical protein AAGA68_16365 [Pseudomonadota bacterium]